MYGAPPAEAVLAEVQTDSRQRFPRSAVELRILDMVEQLAPLPVTPRQIATLLGLHPEQVRLVLQELATLGTVAHPDLGYDRYKGTEAEETPHLDGPFPPDGPAPLTWQEQEVLATLRTAFPRVCSPAELEREIRIRHYRE
jgi:hypothetical protein